MFFFVPWGHDRPVYERPWATIALIAACTLFFLIGYSVEASAEAELMAAAAQIDAIQEQHPEARMHAPVTGLPTRLDELIQPLVDTENTRMRPGDADLEGAVRSAVAALNRLPTIRFGWRSGAPSVTRAITYMFVHAGFSHLFGNMLLLWLAGGLLECFWNRAAFFSLYFVGGLAALLAQYLAAPASMTPLVGASGAVAALLGAFVVGYPRARIKIFYFYMFVVPRWGQWLAPAWVVIPLWAALELVKALLDQSMEGGVAYWAHVGGFIFGALAAVAAQRFGFVAEDAGYDRVVEPLVPARVSVAPRAPVTPVAPLPLVEMPRVSSPPSASNDALPLPPPAPIRSLASLRPAPPAIELSELPPADDYDFER